MVTISYNASETASTCSHFYIYLGTKMVKVPHIGSCVISVDSVLLVIVSKVMNFIYVYLPVIFVSPALSARCPVLKLYLLESKFGTYMVCSGVTIFKLATNTSVLRKISFCI